MAFTSLDKGIITLSCVLLVLIITVFSSKFHSEELKRPQSPKRNPNLQATINKSRVCSIFDFKSILYCIFSSSVKSILYIDCNSLSFRYICSTLLPLVFQLLNAVSVINPSCRALLSHTFIMLFVAHTVFIVYSFTVNR